MNNGRNSVVQRNELLVRRTAPLAVLAFIAFIAGVVTGCPGSPNRDAAERYAAAWAEGDYSAMHGELSTASRSAIPLERFITRYGDSEAMATLESLSSEDAEGDEESAEVPISARTTAFGVIERPLNVTFGEDGIAWRSDLLFPGLEPDEELARDTEFAERAPLLSLDGQEMATGPGEAREYPLGDSMTSVTGFVEAAGEDIGPALVAQGVEPGDPVGTGGLELGFNGRLAGKPGGTLYAVPAGSEADTEGRVLGEGSPKAAEPLKTTIDPEIQSAAVVALAGYIGGVAAVDVKTGALRGVAGSAWSLLQPPGSTMKIVTATAALNTGVATMDSEYEYATTGVADGREIRNAGEKLCGGDFTQAFADSCNSVYAPLGEEVGEEALTDTAEAFGFNKPPAVFNDEGTELIAPPIPTIPEPGEYNNELGVSALGQGVVQATPLLMASVSQGIANDGVVLPTAATKERDLLPDREPVRVASKKVAADMNSVMVAVVTSGTGFAAAIAEGQVAGKTGTAEVGPRAGDPEDLIEDAWFSGFAPADRPELAVGVMVVDAPGDGGTIAAPIAGAVLAAGV